MGLSVAAVVSGYQNFQENNICGVIFNQISPGMYPYYKKIVEENTGLRAYGFLPPDPSVTLKSRHLGLVTAHETQELKSVLTCLGNLGARYLDLDGLLELAQSAGSFPPAPRGNSPPAPQCGSPWPGTGHSPLLRRQPGTAGTAGGRTSSSPL